MALKLIDPEFTPAAATSSRFFMRTSYELGYHLLSVSSNEERLISDRIASNIKLSGCLADIGCGDARITSQLCQYVNRVTIVEPNPILYSLAMSRLTDNCESLSAFNAEYPCRMEKQDVIIFSHVLYHIDRDDWMALFEKLARDLKVGGSLMISLWNRDSDARQLSLRHSPSDRWLCAAEDLEPYFGEMMKSGLEVYASEAIEPIIRPYTLTAARAIFEFLRGDKISDSELGSLGEACKHMVKDGISNRQTLFFLRKI